MIKSHEPISSSDYACYVELLTNCIANNTVSSFEELVRWTQERLGSNAAISCSIETKTNAISNVLISDYPEQWINEYINSNYMAIDPVMKLALASDTIIDWRTAYAQTERDEAVRDFIASAEAHGLASGLTQKYSNSHSSTLTVFSYANVDQDKRHLSAYFLKTLLPLIHQHDSCETTITRQEVMLSPKELLILQFAMEGYKVADIGYRAKVTENTVKFHLKNIYKKMKVDNRAHAVARAIQLGLIK